MQLEIQSNSACKLLIAGKNNISILNDSIYKDHETEGRTITHIKVSWITMQEDFLWIQLNKPLLLHAAYAHISTNGSDKD